MKRLLVPVLCILGVIALMVAAPFVARADDKPAAEVCSFMSLSFLIESNKDRIAKIHVVEGEKFIQYLDKVNYLRAQKKLFALESVGMVIAEFKNGKIGTVLVDKNKCVLPGTLMAGTMAEMINIFKEVQSEHLFDVVGSEGSEI